METAYFNSKQKTNSINYEIANGKFFTNNKKAITYLTNRK